MCRSIKTLRRAEGAASDQEIYEAALQFVRKISGYRRPSPANQEVFERAVHEIELASEELLTSLRPGARLATDLPLKQGQRPKSAV